MSNSSKTINGRETNGTQGTMQGTCQKLVKVINIL